MNVTVTFCLTSRNQVDAFKAFLDTQPWPDTPEPAPSYEMPKAAEFIQDMKTQAPPVPSTVDLNTIRGLVAEKAKTQRLAIKNKLTEFGAESLSLLSDEHYDEFHTFMVEL